MSLRFWYSFFLFPITYCKLPILLPPPPKQCFAGVQWCLLYPGLGIGLRTSGIVGILSTELYLQPYWQFCWQNKNSRLRAPRCLNGLYFWGIQITLESIGKTFSHGTVHAPRFWLGWESLGERFLSTGSHQLFLGLAQGWNKRGRMPIACCLSFHSL